MDRYPSVAFPIYCYRNTIPARNKLPQEAGFIWWFRFNYSLSSTIWNQCSWRKNACRHQWDASLETSVEKKEKVKIFFACFCRYNWLHHQTKSLSRLGLQGLWPDHPWEGNAVCDFEGRNSAVILLGNSVFVVFVGGEPALWKQRRAYKT